MRWEKAKEDGGASLVCGEHLEARQQRASGRLQNLRTVVLGDGRWNSVADRESSLV